MKINKGIIYRFIATAVGFTLIELIVVIAVLGILAGALFVVINPSEQFKKSRDSQRKHDLSQVQKALEAYYNDKGKYPDNISWGSAWPGYMDAVPKDPDSSRTYVYQSPDGGISYKLYAKLERCSDSQIIKDVSCDSNYNYGVSSPNLTIGAFVTLAPTAPASPTPTHSPVATATPTSAAIAAPSLSLVSDNSDSTTPYFINTNVTFTAQATDPGGLQWKLLICKTGVQSGGACDTGQTLCSSVFVNSGLQANCTYKTVQADTPSKNWYAFACNSKNKCSSGNNTASPFYVENKSFIKSWGGLGSGNGQLNTPTKIVVDNLGDVYVVDRNNNRIQKFDTNGNFIRAWGTSGVNPGQFIGPQDIAIDSSNFVYIVDQETNSSNGFHRIQKFDQNGNFLGWSDTTSTGIINASGIDVDNNGNIFVTEKSFMVGTGVARFTSSFVKTAFFKNGSGINFSDPLDVKIFNNEIYVGDYGIIKLTQDGIFLAKWLKFGTGDGEFSGYTYFTIDNSGNIFVVDQGGNRILKFK